MYSSATILANAEKLDFDASTLNFDYNFRNEDDFDTFNVTKGDVATFAHNNGEVPVLEMFQKLVDSMNGDDELYYKFIDFCKGGN